MSDFETALLLELYPVRRALCRCAAVLDAGQRSHPDDDGYRRPASFHVERALEHLRKLQAGDATERHLEHAATRLLMALQAR